VGGIKEYHSFASMCIEIGCYVTTTVIPSLRPALSKLIPEKAFPEFLVSTVIPETAFPKYALSTLIPEHSRNMRSQY
jgi:hypothetical protein